MCVAHSIAPPAAKFTNVSLCLLVVIPNVSGLMCLGIKPGPARRYKMFVHICNVIIFVVRTIYVA